MRTRCALLACWLAAAACGGAPREPPAPAVLLPEPRPTESAPPLSITAPVAPPEARVEWKVTLPGEGPPRLVALPGGDWLVTRTGDIHHDLILGSIDGLVSKVSAGGALRWSKRLSQGTYAIRSALVEPLPPAADPSKVPVTLLFAGGFRDDSKLGRFPLKDTAPPLAGRSSPSAGFVARTSADLDVLAAKAVPGEVTSLVQAPLGEIAIAMQRDPAGPPSVALLDRRLAIRWSTELSGFESASVTLEGGHVTAIAGAGGAAGWTRVTFGATGRIASKAPWSAAPTPVAGAAIELVPQGDGGDTSAVTPFVIRVHRGPTDVYRRTFGAGGNLSLGPDPTLVEARLDDHDRAVLLTTGVVRATPAVALLDAEGRAQGAASLDPGYRCALDDWPGTFLELREGFALVGLWCPRPGGESGPSTVMAKIAR